MGLVSDNFSEYPMVDRKNHRVKRRRSGLSAALVSPQRQRKICRFVKGVIFSRDPRPCKILRGRAYHFCIIKFKGSLRKILSGQPLLAKVIHMPQPAKILQPAEGLPQRGRIYSDKQRTFLNFLKKEIRTEKIM